MTCAACAQRIEKVTSKLSGATESSVNFATEKLTVNFNENVVKLSDIQSTVNKAGYQLHEDQSDNQITMPIEELGDSVMEKVIGNTAVHDRMDIALGGDGSASLTAVHIRVGYDYLAGIPITMMTFMGAGGMMAYGGMMGGYGYYSNQLGTLPGYGGMMGGFGWVWMIVGLLGLIALVAVVVYLTTRNSKQQTFITDTNAVSILKERYARGEITREEYSRMLEVLK